MCTTPVQLTRLSETGGTCANQISRLGRRTLWQVGGGNLWLCLTFAAVTDLVRPCLAGGSILTACVALAVLDEDDRRPCYDPDKSEMRTPL